MTDPVISRLGQTAAKGGAFAMLAAITSFAVSRDPVALLVFLPAISIVQLLCLVRGPWTAQLLQGPPASTVPQRRRRA